MRGRFLVGLSAGEECNARDGRGHTGLEQLYRLLGDLIDAGAVRRACAAAGVEDVEALLWELARGGGEPAYGARVADAQAAPRPRAGGFWHGRLHTWRATIDTIRDRPLAGAGADAFLVASARHQQDGPVRFAHDLPLELTAELGVPGGVLALALYAATAAALWRARRTRAAWLFGPAAAAFLGASLLDWPWHLAGSGAVWAAALGAIAGAASAPTVTVAIPETTT
jgi:hypothetical protein